MIRIFLDLFVISRLYSVIISDARDPRIILPAKLIHKSNEVIGHNLEFGIRTMARESWWGYGEEVGDDDDEGGRRGRKKKKERKENGATEEGGEGARWYVGAAVLESVPDREEKKESGSVWIILTTPLVKAIHERMNTYI